MPILTQSSKLSELSLKDKENHDIFKDFFLKSSNEKLDQSDQENVLFYDDFIMQQEAESKN
jgi:hypothetical protein